jgi:hypothetical protein
MSPHASPDSVKNGAGPPLPFSLEAEISVLGGMLADAAAVPRALELINPAMFYAEGHRRLFLALSKLWEQGSALDPVTVSEALKTAGDFDVAGGHAYLAEVMDAVPSAANLDDHARIVAEKASARRIAKAARAVAENPTDLIARQVLAQAIAEPTADRGNSLARPLGVRELLEQPEPDDQWLFEGLIPMDANLLLAGYPKSHKTNFILEAAVAAASRTAFLGQFKVPRQHRVGLILMEDRAHRIRRRLRRICQSHGAELEDLEGWLHLWFRPALSLSNARAMGDLAAHVDEYDLDAIFVDNWAYVSTGNSNDADEVTPQLAALAALREAKDGGLVVGLTHHARKTPRDADTDRLTDLIRNSSAFGAWYDVGIVLARTNETAPVNVRAELRDHPSPAAFAFTVVDEHPASLEHGPYPSGYLRLQATTRTADQLERESAADRLKPDVLKFLEENPGCSKRKLREVPGDNALVDAAFATLCRDGLARFDVPEGRGKSGQCWLTLKSLSRDGADRAGTVLPAQSDGGVLSVLKPPVGGQHTAHPPDSESAGAVQHTLSGMVV